MFYINLMGYQFATTQRYKPEGAFMQNIFTAQRYEQKIIYQMEMWEIISAVIGSDVVVVIITYITTRKSVQIKNEGDKDNVLLKRIDFLDKRISDLEKRACFRSGCDQRI